MSLERLLDSRNLKIWDWPKQSVEVAFIPGRAEGNWEGSGGFHDGLIVRAIDGYHGHCFRYVVIPGNDGSYVKGVRQEHGYPGGEVWKDILTRQGIPSKNIFLPGEKGINSHTRTETDDFIAVAQAHNWTTGIVLMNQHETARVMLGLLKVFQETGYLMKIYPVTPRNDWNTFIYGSGGLTQMPRALHIPEELRRIPKYQEQGDLASWNELDFYYREVLQVEW